MNLKAVISKVKAAFKKPTYSFTCDPSMTFSPDSTKDFKKALIKGEVTAKALGAPIVKENDMMRVDTLFYFNRFNRNKIYEMKSYRLDEITNTIFFVFEDISAVDFKSGEVRMLFELSVTAINQFLVPIKENKVSPDSNPTVNIIA